MDKGEIKYFYVNQLRNYYGEIIIYLITFVVTLFYWHHAWIPIVAWGICLFLKGNSLRIFDDLSEKYLGDWEKKKAKDFEEKKKAKNKAKK